MWCACHCIHFPFSDTSRMCIYMSLVKFGMQKHKSRTNMSNVTQGYVMPLLLVWFVTCVVARMFRQYITALNVVIAIKPILMSTN